MSTNTYLSRHSWQCSGLVLLAILITACSATRAPIDDSDLRLQAASHAFGGSYDYLIVTASGRWTDQAALGIGQIIGPNQLSRDLATRLLKAEKQRLRIVVSGQNREKTLRVIRDAFSFIQQQRLTQLEFLFLGHPGDSEQISKLVTQTGGQYRFAAF